MFVSESRKTGINSMQHLAAFLFIWPRQICPSHLRSESRYPDGKLDISALLLTGCFPSLKQLRSLEECMCDRAKAVSRSKACVYVCVCVCVEMSEYGLYCKALWDKCDCSIVTMASESWRFPVFLFFETCSIIFRDLLPRLYIPLGPQL